MDDTLAKNVNGVCKLSHNCGVSIIAREEWGARPSKEINYMGTPVGVVFIHHTIMNACQTLVEGKEEMKIIQNFHMDDRGWDDIGYNFLIAEDGKAYEGRAWNRIGAHTLGWNDVAIAFSIMGEFTKKLPKDSALQTLKEMIELGVKIGKIKPDYKLYGHRDVRETECPGGVLYDHIRTWSHFDNNIPVKPLPILYKQDSIKFNSETS